MAERPLYTLYKNLKAQNYDVPDDYNKFESALTRDGKGGADNRHAIYENLKAQNFDVPDTYERFYSALFEPRSKTSSRAKGGSVPMTAADRARFSAGAQAISASAQQTMDNAGRYNKLKQRKQKQQKDFGRVNLGTHQTPYGGDANNVVKDDFAYNPETGKAGVYVTSDSENAYTQNDAEQKQNLLDKYGEEWNNAVDMGIVPSELDKADPDLSDTDVAMRQMERRQEWLNENQDRRSKELNESMHLQGSPFVASGGAVAPSSFNTAISNEANLLSDVEYGAYNTAKAYNQMLRTTLLQELKEQKQRNENAGWWKDKWNDVSNYFGAMFNTMLDPKLYSQGVMDAAIANNVIQVKKGMEDGTIKKGSNAGNAAQAMLGAIQQQQAEAAKQQQYGTKAYQYGDMSGRSLKFMGDFALSGWRNVMTTGFTKAGEKVGEKMALGALGKWFTKNTGRVLGDIAGSAALAATNQLGSTYNNMIERYVGMNNENGGVTQGKNGDLKFNEGVSLGKAIKDGFGSATIENFSEMFGEYLPGAPKLLSKLGLSKVSAFFEKIGNNAYYKWLSNATNKSGIQGVMAEISEEEFGTALHAAWGDGDGSWSDFNVFTNPDAREKQIDTCLGMFYSVGFMQAPRTAVGAINAVQYFNIKHQVAKADKFGQVMFNDKWEEIKSKIDVTTNADLTKTVLDATRSDSMTAKQKGAVINYAMFLSKLRGFNQAADAKTKDKVEEGDTAPTLSNDLDDAYTEGHNADDADKHDIQLEQNDKANELAAMLHITPEQLHDMADEDLEAMTGQDDKLDQAIYDYQVSTAKYQGVMDGAQDEVDMAAQQAAMETDNMTDLSRGTVRKATIKATGGLEDYEVYIISGNIATHDDGSIDVGNSDDMIIYYDPTTGRKEHADAMMFADLIEELPAADVKAQAIIDAKENAIKKVAGIIDGTVEVGSQFSVTDADGTEHTYEVLADYGDGTAAISIDGNVVENPYSLADLQQMKDLEDQKRLEAAKAEREQMEKERAEQQTQETQQTEETQPSFDFTQILNDNGNVVLADVLGKDGNTKYPNSQLFLIRDSGAKAKVMELTSDGSLIPHAVNKKDVRTATTMTLDEYKQAFAATSMIEDNSGVDRGGIEVESPTIEGETAAPTEETAAPESTETPATEQAPTAPAIALEDGTIVPMLEDGNPDFSKLTAEQTAELYDSQFGEDADSIVSGYVSDAKKALDKASNMTVNGKTFVEQKAAKDAKEKAIADAQAAYDSAIAIRDAYNERQLAKVEDTAEGRKKLIEKARRKFARLKSAVKDDAEAVAQIYKETVGTLLHRLYDGTGIDVTDTIPLTAEEYVASNLGAHSLNYEGTETSKGVKQETGLSREDFAKTQLLAADGKGTTIDALVHSLWENRPSNLESLDTQDIRNALIGVLNSGFKASEARNFVENIRIAQAENILEELKRAQENAAYAEQQKAEQEVELKAKSDEKAESEAKSEEKLDNELSNESNDLDNETDNEKINDNINDNINVPEDATDDAPLGEQRDESDLPFSAKENGTQQTTAERAADVEKNKVDDVTVVDNIVGKKTRKTLEKLAKMMGANVQWQYSDKNANGWFDDKTNTIYLTLDSSITEGVLFIFGHEMTHEMRTKNPAAYNELKTLVKDMMGEDNFNKETDRITSLYNENNVFYNGGRTAYEEEVVADQLGKWIRDANYAHTLLLKMSHPLLARLHEIVNRFLMALHGIEISDDMNLILRSIEQAYVKTAKGEITNSETGEDVSFSLRQKPEPKKKGIGYKVFVLKDGKLYPPMVANPNGAETPVGVWLDADAAPIAGESKTGRPQVKQGGKGTQGGSGKLAYRPGWHLGVVPYAIQFNRKDAEGNKTLFPKNFVFAEVEYAADVDYQEEARQEGINPSGKYQHSLAGLKHLPTDGYYMYRTNPNPETDPWVITGAMKVNRILTRAEQAELVKNAGREPQQIQEGDIVTDDVVNSINQEIADAPKFSLKVYHGSGADFTEFDFDHMGEGEGSQAFGWGGYVTNSKEIGKDYTRRAKSRKANHAHFYANMGSLIANDWYEYFVKTANSESLEDAKEFVLKDLDIDIKVDENKLNRNEIPESKRANIVANLKEEKRIREIIANTKKEDLPNIASANLYEVDIPEDNGSNYLDWDAPITDELIDKVAKVLPSLRSYDIKDLKKDRTFDNFYKTISMRSVTDDATFNDDKAASKLLSSLGYTGIKYKAGRNFGGAEVGDTNYVIFKPEDMRITEHTKFSLKTYHGTGANFDRFDTSHAYEGAGSETFGHGIYVTKSAKIGASYALKAKVKKIKTPKAFKAIKNGDNWFGRFIDNAVRSSFAKAKKETFNRMDELIKEDENIVNDETKPEWKQNAAQKELADFDKLKSLFEGLTEEDIPSLKRAKANRYEVEIPDDTGNNYLDWNKPMKKEQKKIVREGLEKLGVDVDRLVRNGYSLDKNFGDVYNGLLYYALNGTKFEERDSFVASSNFLSSLGFTGIKYYAGTIWGGAKKGDLNYVIFNEDDAKIVGNTKFSLKKVNGAFNQRLDELVKNPNQKDKILRLGRSSSFLKAGGIADAEIELDFDKLMRKSKQGYVHEHPFDATDVKDLPMAIANPISVFDNTNGRNDGQVILTELKKEDRNFIVAIQTENQNRKGGVVLKVNKIVTLFPKDARGVINWFNQGKATNIDKEKALHFIEALQNHSGTTITDEELKSAANIINSFETTKENGEKVEVEEPKTFEEFLNHPSLKFSIKNEEQRKAAEDAYEYASKLRPNKYAQYALVDMSNPLKSPEYYEKKVLADRWRRFYNKAVHNELDDVYKDAWGNYKLFDLDRPFADQVNEVKGDVPSEFNAPDVVANKNADNESGAEYHEYKQGGLSSVTYEDRYKAFKQREANRKKVAGLKKELKETEDSYNLKGKERAEYHKQLMKAYMDKHKMTEEYEIPDDDWKDLRSKSFEKYQDELDSLFNKYKDLDRQIKAVAEPRFSLKDEKIKSVAEKFGVNEDDVAMYANAVERGSTAEAARARANIKRYLLQVNEGNVFSFKDIIKYTKPVNEALKENFGDLDAMIEERRKQVEAERNAMEAARKRAQEEEEKRQKHLEELSLIPTDELDKRYMDAIANKDESTAREMLDESARRKGYDDADSDYQGQGAWAAPSNPQYESDKERRADIDNAPDVNLEDIALGYSLQPDDYFSHPERYSQNTPHGLESVKAINTAIDAIKNGEKDVKVKVYRAVPTSVKEGKLRNGDWVTPSKKYAEMHGDHRLEGKYRIIEDEVPANQLWWDGNDANEFGFDDGKEYRYKNAKNNRKLNDLITYDNKGNVIPPSKRFNSRKSDIRFSLAGERGAAAADKAEERTIRMDNLSVAKDMEKNKKKAKAIKAATGWERGADGKWRYEMPDVILRDPKEWVNKKTLTLSDIVEKPNDLFKEYPELFDAYPELKDVKIQKGRAKMGGSYYDNTITLNLGYIREAIKSGWDTYYKTSTRLLKMSLVHEIQHYIQEKEGFAQGGNSEMIVDKNALDAIEKLRAEKEAVAKEFYAMSPDEKQRRKYEINNRYNDLTKQIERLEKSSRIGYDGYKRLSGEVEARNVSARLDMTPEERRKSLAESTEDVARKDQIFLGVGDVSFSLRDMADGKESGAAAMAEDLKSLNTPDEVDDAIKTAIEDMPSGWQMANKKMIHVAQALGENRKAEIASEEPKFSLKDGTLIKAGTYFSGGGLVEEGLKGIIDPVIAVEYDEKISGVYRNNFGQHIVTADVRDVDPKELVKQIDGEVEYFHASPVCKNYSQAKSNHAEVELDKETAASTAEFINAVKPKVVTIENVKGYKDSEAMKTITDALDANGYTWDADVYNAADYGGYTNRERLIVRAVRDGKLPEKPKKMAHKSGWYEAVADIIPTLTEKKNGVAPWMDVRLKADGIDWRNIDKPLYVMGSAYADGKIPHAFADELLPTLRTKSGDVIVMPDGKVYRAMGRVLARVSGVSDDYKMPFSENLSHTIIGNGIPTQLTEHVIAPLLQNTLRPTTPEDGNTKFSLRYDQFEHDLNQWKKDNNLPKDAQRPTIPQRNAGESAVDFLRRVDEYRKQMALWKTAPTYEQHLLSDDTALGEFNRELQRGSVLKRIAFQDSMLAIRKAQEAIMKEVGVDRLNMAEDAYTAENRSHGKGKNEFEEYNNEFLQPLRKAYHQMKKVLGNSYDNVRIYMMAKHGLERDTQMAFKKSLDADYEDVAQRSAAYRAYKGDMNRITNDSDLEFGRVDFNTWRQRDNALRTKYSPSYMDYRYDENGIAYDYSGLSALFGGSDFEEAAHKLVRDIESSHVAEVQDLWNATNAATKKILRDGYKAGMMSKDAYQYVRDMYSHYIPLRGWDGTTADQVWDYVGGGKGAFNQTLKTAHGRTSIADDPIAYIENMAESGILLNNKNWVKQHLMLLAQNHPTSLLTLSKAWYVKSTDANGNEEWIPATPQITSQMNSNQVKAAIDAFEKKMEQMAQTGDATQKRDGLNIAYPQTHSEEREHEVRVMKDGEEYVIYVNGDPQLAQAMNNTRAHRVREIQSGKLDRAAAWLGRKMAAAYTSLSPLFIPSNYFRDLTMTLASTAIREDGRYNYLLRKNLATSWNLGFMLRDYQNGKLREKVSNGNATPKEQMFYDFMMNGGETGFVSSLDVEDLKKKFKNDLKDLDRWKANPVKVGHTIMDAIEFLNRAIEDSNRFAVYMTSIQYGRSIDEAVNDAKDVTLNFNRKGTGEYGWQMVRNLYLFINPAVQSLQTLGALAKHHPFKFTAVTASWLASGVLVPVVNAALMSLLGGDDDKDKYWQFTKWDRRNNLIMWVPFTHEYVKIPLAQEFRAFYGIGDMIASKMMGGELAEESWSQYGEDLLGQVVDMLPLDPTGYDGNIAVSLMPNAIRPVFELAFNVDFTGKPLFKDTEYNKYDPNFTKAYVGTPDWLVRASRMVNSIGNDYPDVQQNSIDAFGDPRYNLNNPAVVDHVLSSYLGGAYTMGSQVLGVLTKSLNDPKEIKVADIPLFSKFVSNPDDRPVTKKQGDEFWNMKENHDRAANTLSKLKKQAKVDGDYSMLERFYDSEEYKQYKQDDAKVKKYEEDKKKERAEESGEEYRPHKLNAEDIYKAHATPKDDFEDLKLKQLYTKLNGFKTSYDLLVDTAPSQSDGYYNTNKAAIDAIDEISLDKQEISELKKGFLDDGKDAYNTEDMKRIRELRKNILAVLEKANKVVVANQKAKAEK